MATKTATVVVHCTVPFTTATSASGVVPVFGTIPDVKLPGSTSGAVYTVVWQFSRGSSGGVAFNTVEWGTGERPSKLKPGIATKRRNGSRQIARGIWNSNDAAGNAPESFGYKIVVKTLNQKLYTSSDPELVLSPPG